jgi:hypothetical protein
MGEGGKARGKRQEKGTGNREQGTEGKRGEGRGERKTTSDNPPLSWEDLGWVSLLIRR